MFVSDGARPRRAAWVAHHKAPYAEPRRMSEKLAAMALA